MNKGKILLDKEILEHWKLRYIYNFIKIIKKKICKVKELKEIVFLQHKYLNKNFLKIYN